jgi:hypothetical protein
MNQIVVVDRVMTEDGDFVELTHNSAQQGRVYRVEIEMGFIHWNEWYTTLDGELNARLARDKFIELKAKFIERKEMA